MATLGWRKGSEGKGLFGWLGSNLFIYVLSCLFYFGFINYLGKGKELLLNALVNEGSQF